MRIGIGVPTRNRPYHLVLLLSALLRQTKEDWDLVIVNDWDDEANLEEDKKVRKLVGMMSERGHRVRIVRGVLLGPPFAHNIAMRNLDHELILRLDDDQLPEPDFLEKLCRPFENDIGGKIGAVGGVYPCLDLTLVGKDGREECLQTSYHTKDACYSVEVLHSSFVYRRRVVEKIGKFPECYSAVGHREETDTSMRIKTAGYKLLVVTKAVAWHFMADGGVRDIPNHDELKKRDDAVFMKRFGRRPKWKDKVGKNG